MTLSESALSAFLATTLTVKEILMGLLGIAIGWGQGCFWLWVFG